MGDWKEKLRELDRGLSGNKSNSPTNLKTLSLPGRAPTSPAEKRYVCLGFDFGTSSTKAVVQLLQLGQAYAIPFPGLASKEQPYLAATRLSVDDRVDDRQMLSLAAQGQGAWVEELKVKLMERPWESTPIVAGSGVSARPADLASGYVSLTLRHALDWFEKNVRPVLGKADLVWSMNLGIPARDYDAQEIRLAFHAVALAAWHMAIEGGPIDLPRTTRIVDAARRDGFAPKGIEAAQINVVPEVAGGVTAYARSPQRQAGPHLFVDVGATTLDSSLFLLHQSAQGLKYVFLEADVDSKLGALRLHHYRADQLGHLAMARFAAANPLKPIPDTARQCMPTGDEIDGIDQRFRDRCIVNIDKVVVRAKNKAPNDVSVSEDGGSIRVLLSGGGIRLPLYRGAVEEAGARAAPSGGLGLRVKPFRVIDVPQPSTLLAPGLTGSDWQRVAIAYGLSFAYDDIGEFVPPSQIPPFEGPRTPDHESTFVSKDQV